MKSNKDIALTTGSIRFKTGFLEKKSGAAKSDKEIFKKFGDLFWDVAVSELSLPKHRFFIIERLLGFGTPTEINWIFRRFSPDEISEVVKKSRILNRKTVHFWTVHFNISREETKCFQSQLIENCFY